ncbi:MAG: hypothetical protein RR334_02405 [Clostridia bacterium]
MQAVEDKQAKKQHRPHLPVNIKNDKDWDCYGMFEVKGGKQTLYLNINVLTDISLRFHALESVIHEGRHALQYKIVSQDKLPFFAFRAKKWKKNWQGYISNNENVTAYGMQSVERDAQKYTMIELERLKFKYRNEGDFEKTFSALEKRYTSTKDKARKEFGVFYNYKINKKIDRKIQNSK